MCIVTATWLPGGWADSHMIHSTRKNYMASVFSLYDYAIMLMIKYNWSHDRGVITDGLSGKRWPWIDFIWGSTLAIYKPTHAHYKCQNIHVHHFKSQMQFTKKELSRVLVDLNRYKWKVGVTECGMDPLERPKHRKRMGGMVQQKEKLQVCAWTRALNPEPSAWGTTRRSSWKTVALWERWGNEVNFKIKSMFQVRG